MPGWPVFWSEGAMGHSGFFFPSCSSFHCSWLCSKHPGRDSYPVHGWVSVLRSTALAPLCTSWDTQEPLATPFHHSLEAWDQRACTALLHIRMEGSFDPSESISFFFKCSALEMDFFLLWDRQQNHSRAGTTVEKTNRATTCFQQCSAVTCFYRTLGSCSTTLTRAACMLLHRILFIFFLTKYSVFLFSWVSTQETWHKFASYSLEKA